MEKLVLMLVLVFVLVRIEAFDALEAILVVRVCFRGRGSGAGAGEVDSLYQPREPLPLPIR